MDPTAYDPLYWHRLISKAWDKAERKRRHGLKARSAGLDPTGYDISEASRPDFNKVVEALHAIQRKEPI